MAVEYVRICPKCKLVYKPDERIYKNPHEICPKCGARLVEEDKEKNDGRFKENY